jgi:hypothetical protein
LALQLLRNIKHVLTYYQQSFRDRHLAQVHVRHRLCVRHPELGQRIGNDHQRGTGGAVAEEGLRPRRPQREQQDVAGRGQPARREPEERAGLRGPVEREQRAWPRTLASFTRRPVY